MPQTTKTSTGSNAAQSATAATTIAVIYNPIKVDHGEFRRAVDELDEGLRAGTLWLETTEDDPGGGQAREAVEAGVSVVLVAGGDGTVRAVAEVLAGTDVALCLVPSGTGNLLARNLKLAVDDREGAISAALRGTDRKIDVASIEIVRPDGSKDEHVFLVMAGVGLDAKIMSNTDSELKAKIGWLAYAKALVGVLRDKDFLRIHSRSDHYRRRHTRAQAVIVGNCGSLPANILLLPEAVVDDGLLDIVVLKPESIRGWLQVFVKVFLENGVVKRIKLGRKVEGIDTNAIDFAQLPEFEVRLSRSDQIELDGDPFGDAIGFRATALPGALRLRVPSNE